MRRFDEFRGVFRGALSSVIRAENRNDIGSRPKKRRRIKSDLIPI